MGLFDKILAPVDGSRYSLDAVVLAAKLAAFHDSQLKLFHVIDVLLVDQLKRLSGIDQESTLEELRQRAEGFLKDMEREAASHGADPQAHIEEGVPHDAILKEVLSWKADLIVMGKLGRRGVSHMVLGSVTERVIEFSDVPVLVVK